MIKKPLRGIAMMFICGTMMYMTSFSVFAAPRVLASVSPDGKYIVTVQADSVNINKGHESGEVLTEALKGASFPVVENLGDGWMKVQVGSEQGYVQAETGDIYTGNGTGAVGQADAQEAADSRREVLVNYALQYVGCRYVDAGNSPATGFDCSGFTRYVMQNGAGISINRSSRAQSTQGVAVNSAQMRPGDLIFYGSGKSINHVALYIGNGQVVHASTYATGVKTSPWNYRAPVKIVNVMGD